MIIAGSRFESQIVRCPSPKCTARLIWCSSDRLDLLIDVDPVPYVKDEPYGDLALVDNGGGKPRAVKLKPHQRFGRQGTLHTWHYETCAQGKRYQRKAYQR